MEFHCSISHLALLLRYSAHCKQVVLSVTNTDVIITFVATVIFGDFRAPIQPVIASYKQAEVRVSKEKERHKNKHNIVNVEITGFYLVYLC